MDTLPKTISPALLAFCRTISNHKPVFIPSTPSGDAQRMACFDNVASKVAGDGGKLAYGWAIWHLPNLYFEAEHHGVWQSNSGELLDVSPQPNGEKRILFLPDPQAVYDRKQHRPNLLGPANGSSSAIAFAKLGNEKNEIIRKYRTDEYIVMVFSPEDRKRLAEIDVELQFSLAVYQQGR